MGHALPSITSGEHAASLPPLSGQVPAGATKCVEGGRTAEKDKSEKQIPHQRSPTAGDRVRDDNFTNRGKDPTFAAQRVCRPPIDTRRADA